MKLYQKSKTTFKLVTYKNKANALTELKRFDEALENYGMAINLDPEDASLLCNAATVLEALERFDEALQ
ncbi:MAG: tetratricopeptide repeat protein, partial [Pedobacter sp.]